MRRLEIRHHYQIIVRLQVVRGWIYELSYRDLARETAALEELSTGIQSVANAARESGLRGYAEVCREIQSRFESALRRGGFPEAALELIDDWAASSELYLRRPHSHAFARALVMRLTEPRWGIPIDDLDQARLIDELLERRAPEPDEGS